MPVPPENLSSGRTRPTEGVQLVFATLFVAWSAAGRFLSPPLGDLSADIFSIILPLAFAVLALVMRGATLSGAIAGIAVAHIVWIHWGPEGFAVLFIVFLSTYAATRYRYQYKLKVGLADGRRARDAFQVMANLGVAAVFISYTPAVSAIKLAIGLGLGALAALCEAIADTVSSEIGKAASNHAYLFPTFRMVPAGTNGAITWVGTLSGVAGALLIPATWASIMKIKDGTVDQGFLLFALIAAACGIAGAFVDSLLGATLEKRGWLNNDSVNLLGTASAAGLAWLVVGIFG